MHKNNLCLHLEDYDASQIVQTSKMEAEVNNNGLSVVGVELT